VENSNEDSEKSQILVDFENQEEDNEDNPDNEEQEEDSEDEFLKHRYKKLSVSNEFSMSYFKYLLKLTQERVKEEIAPPEILA
jgi:hypothetical protein